MRIRKTIPPAAVPISFPDLLCGLKGYLGSDMTERVGREIRDFFGTPHVYFLSSGKAALFLLLVACRNVRNRSTVIVPAYTCFSVPSAVRMAGLEIVPCDIRADSLDFDYEHLSELVDENCLCIIATHLFGIRSNVERIRGIASRHGVFVIEDSAQSFCAPMARKQGEIGDAAVLSLGRGKSITCGSGGGVVINSVEIAEALQGHYNRMKDESTWDSIRNMLELTLMEVFINPYLYWFPDGIPSLRIGETRFYSGFPVWRIHRTKFGLLRNWSENLHGFNRTRIEVAEGYKAMLDLDRKLSIYSTEIPYLRFPVFLRNGRRKTSVCNQFRHLGISPMYPSPINTIREIKDHVRSSHCPMSKKISNTLVTLPTHRFVDTAVMEKICTAIRTDIDPSWQDLSDR